MEEQILAAIRSALGVIREPRYFETERGYQAELYCELRSRIKVLDFGGAKPILEQEYQKRADDHGLRNRPDILIHEPFDAKKHPNRGHGNFAIIELKLNATDREAKQDFEHLAVMMERLSYSLGVFINLGSEDSKIECARHPKVGKIAAFGVLLKDGNIQFCEGAI